LDGVLETENWVMGLSRRSFTKEFKLAAVLRLEKGVSIAEIARGMAVNPNVLHRWRREIREGPGHGPALLMRGTT